MPSLLLLIAYIASLQLLVFGDCAAQYPTRLLYQYPRVGNWIENAAVRRNGSILFTSLNSPAGLHTLDPFADSSPVLVTNAFDGLNSTLGIVETVPDTFYVLASNFSLDLATLGTQERSNAVYKVNSLETNSDGEPHVSLLTEMPQAKFLNGLTKFNDSLLLAADSDLGVLWAISTETGASAIVAKDPLMAPRPQEGGGFREGVNGVHARGRTVYFTNSQRRIFGRVALNENAETEGPAVQIATPAAEKGVITDWDDFVVDREGSFAYVATLAGNSVQRVDLRSGKVEIIAGGLNSTAIAGPTSVALGRNARDRDVLYVMTTGGLAAPVYDDGEARQVGAQIVAIDLCDRES
ncbi:hypothetical protein LTR37_015071 [Vermiconidia calcicola]|uniref:Uncharacterized protein n=1 Tax=Vermiconidia calcicola TaxID=1690605 RepID=A0ACC3MRP9_9PEZI|nr:hypothetical protein LTR37_015071 [Vermiconidia calcicola]